MTKATALLETHKMWLQMAIEEEESGEIAAKPKTKYLHDCACCQYVFDIGDSKSTSMKFHDCKKLCPMIPVWPYGCERQPSPYVDWEKEALGAARKIAIAALKLYEKEIKRRRK